MKSLILAALLGLGFANAGAAEVVQGANNAVGVEFGTDLSSLPVGEFVEVPFTLTGAGNSPILNAEVSVSGGMPAHGHGLPTAPEVEEIGNGAYVIKGLKLSMSGEWVLILDVTAADVSDRVSIDFGL